MPKVVVNGIFGHTLLKYVEMLNTCYLFNLLPNDAVKSGIQSNHCVEFFSTSIPTKMS